MLDSAVKAFFAFYGYGGFIVRNGVSLKSNPAGGIIIDNIAVAVMLGNGVKLYRFGYCGAFFPVSVS